MIVDSTFFLMCCKASRLLEPVDHPLHPFPCAVESPVKRPCVTRMPLPRNGDPDAVLPAIAPALAPAGTLVAHNAVGTALGPPAPRPLDGPLDHQVGKDRGLMAVARRQDAWHALAMACRPHMDLGTAAALTPTECVGVCATFVGARRLVMRPDDRAIHLVDIPVEVSTRVGLLWDSRKESRPDPRLAPAIQAARDGGPWAIRLRQIAPGGAGAEEPQETVEDAAVVSGGAACSWLWRGKQGLESFPWSMSQFMSMHSMQ